MKKKLSFCVLLVLISVLHAAAWPFGGKDDEKKDDATTQRPEAGLTRRYHLSIPDKETENQLLLLSQSKRMLSENSRVLRRFVDDRQQRFEGLEKLLKERYDIDPESKYQYDRKARVLYKLVLLPTEAASENEATTETKLHTHKKLASDEEADKLLDLLAAKKRLGQDLAVFRRTAHEQDLNIKKVADMLEKKFAIKEGHLYDYDAKTMRLYEIIRADAGGAE